MEPKFELHPDLKDASLEAACKMADGLHTMLDNGNPTILYHKEKAADLHYMLEYLRLNFDLVPKSEKWVLRGGTEKQPLFWDPKKGWVRTPFEAKKYETQASAKTALERYHGRRFQRDGVDVVRVTP